MKKPAVTLGTFSCSVPSAESWRGGQLAIDGRLEKNWHWQVMRQQARSFGRQIASNAAAVFTGRPDCGNKNRDCAIRVAALSKQTNLRSDASSPVTHCFDWIAIPRNARFKLAKAPRGRYSSVKSVNLWH
jgi:hypothetical protein